VTEREVRIAVRVTARAHADQIDGVDGGHLRVRVVAAPTDGRANASVTRLIAEALGVPPSHARVVAGVTNRHKIVAVDGVSRADLARRWPELRD
jgi:uncharacterized protein